MLIGTSRHPKRKSPALLEHFLSDRLGSSLGIGIVVRQKHHAHGEIPFLVKRVTQSGDFGHEKLVGNLRYHACAVPRLRIGIERATVHQIANRTKSKPKNPV